MVYGHSFLFASATLNDIKEQQSHGSPFDLRLPRTFSVPNTVSTVTKLIHHTLKQTNNLVRSGDASWHKSNMTRLS